MAFTASTLTNRYQIIAKLSIHTNSFFGKRVDFPRYLRGRLF